MKSMTGYGSHLTDCRLGESQKIFEVTVKSLNSRFLETRFLLPGATAALDNEVKNLVQKYFLRGRIEVTIRRKYTDVHPRFRTIVQVEMARQWVDAYKRLGDDLNLMAEPNLEMVARLPEVISFAEDDDLSPKESKILLDGLEKAIQACMKEREREGSSTQKELIRLLVELHDLSEEVLKMRAKADKDLKRLYMARLDKIGVINASSDPRFIQEVALLAEKSDIAEEIMRIQEHVKNMRKLVSSNEASGKKLDFYTQELLREINTIGSKTQVAKLTHLVVEGKSIVEQLKEQVQNIE